MARTLGRRQGREDAYYWPGFVDAMAQLLLVITFLMSLFMITQFLLSREISGRDTVLSRLKAQIAELTQLLAEKVLVGGEEPLSGGPVAGQGLALTGQQRLKRRDDDRLPRQGDQQVTRLPRLPDQRGKVHEQAANRRQ